MSDEMNKKLFDLLDNRRFYEFMKLVDSVNAVDTADFLETLEDDKLITAFRILKKDSAADVFAELSYEAQERIITVATERETSMIIEDLFVDDAVDMLEELPAGTVKKILRSARPETRAIINKFLSYPENSAGGIMTAEFVDVKKNMTISSAIERIRKIGIDKETVYVAYVTDSARKLQGIISLKDMLFASGDDLVENIMTSDFIFGHTLDDKEEIAATISKYDLLALPIVDTENRLVGIVTVDDAIDVIEEEATEDIEKMAAITPADRPYMKTGIFEIFKNRVPWLLLLMVSATFTGSIIQRYSDALGAYMVLTAFIPMLMDTGGNAGGQASVTIIRGLSLGEIEIKNILRVIWKEFRVSLLCGITLAAATFVKLLIFDRPGLLVALVVCATLLISVIIAKVIGSTLPIVAKKIGFDPAVMASPFITTIVDALSLVIYFQIATVFLNI